MNYNFYDIGERIRQERKKNEWSQDKLIEMLESKNVHIGRNTLSNIENGLTKSDNFSLKLLTALCDLFKCDIGYLLCEYDQKNQIEKEIVNTLHLSEKSIDYLNKHGQDSIVKKSVSPLTDLFNESTEYQKLSQPNEEYAYTLNTILEVCPELIVHIGRIFFHKELLLSEDGTSNKSISPRHREKYNIDSAVIKLAINLKKIVTEDNPNIEKNINSTSVNKFILNYISEHIQ